MISFCCVMLMFAAAKTRVTRFISIKSDCLNSCRSRTVRKDAMHIPCSKKDVPNCPYANSQTRTLNNIHTIMLPNAMSFFGLIPGAVLSRRRRKSVSCNPITPQIHQAL